MYNKPKNVTHQNLIKQIEAIEKSYRITSMQTRARYRSATRAYIRFLKSKLNENNR